MHPNGRKVLVHARDAFLRMLDLRRYVIAKGRSTFFTIQERLFQMKTPFHSIDDDNDFNHFRTVIHSAVLVYKGPS